MKRSQRSYPGTAAVTLALVSLATPALHAVDGAREIHQACVATGCFPGDPPGYPVLVTAPGSYVLTSNLTVDQHTTAISVQTGNVTIDLGGFAILGPTRCTVGNPGSCAPLGAGRGIINVSNPTGSLTVRNGVIEGMGSTGIVSQFDGSSGLFEQLTIKHCGSIGLAANYAEIRSNVFDLNNQGFSCAFCVAKENVVTRSVDYGMFGGNGSLFLGNSSSLNGGLGLWSSSAYGSNLFRSNNGGDANPQVGSGFQLGTNLCGFVACP
jgi:hypothetical protein